MWLLNSALGSNMNEKAGRNRFVVSRRVSSLFLGNIVILDVPTTASSEKVPAAIRTHRKVLEKAS